jgi:hypothetical protein
MRNVDIQSTIHFSRLAHEYNVFRIHAVARAITVFIQGSVLPIRTKITLLVS